MLAVLINLSILSRIWFSRIKFRFKILISFLSLRATQNGLWVIDCDRRFFSTFSLYPGGFPLYGTICHLYRIDRRSCGLHRWYNVSLVKEIILIYENQSAMVKIIS